jgi:hypothetical protein
MFVAWRCRRPCLYCVCQQWKRNRFDEWVSYSLSQQKVRTLVLASTHGHRYAEFPVIWAPIIFEMDQWLLRAPSWPKTLSSTGLWPTRKASPSSTLLTCLCPFYSAINKYCPVRQMVCGWQFGTQGPDWLCCHLMHPHSSWKLASQHRGSVLSFVKRCSLQLLQ